MQYCLEPYNVSNTPSTREINHDAQLDVTRALVNKEFGRATAAWAPPTLS